MFAAGASGRNTQCACGGGERILPSGCAFTLLQLQIHELKRNCRFFQTLRRLKSPKFNKSAFHFAVLPDFSSFDELDVLIIGR